MLPKNSEISIVVCMLCVESHKEEQLATIVICLIIFKHKFREVSSSLFGEQTEDVMKKSK
jgi:hypothetical protein